MGYFAILPGFFSHLLLLLKFFDLLLLSFFIFFNPLVQILVILFLNRLTVAVELFIVKEFVLFVVVKKLANMPRLLKRVH